MINRDQFRKAFIEEIRNELLRDNNIVVDGVGLFTKKHVQAEEENQPDGTILLHPPKDVLEFDPGYKAKTNEKHKLISKLTDSLNIHQDILKGYLNEIVSDINAVLPGDETRIEGWGIFKREKTTLSYIADPILQLEINYEFAGQQPIVLLEGSGIFFTASEDIEGDKPSETGEFIMLDKEPEPKKKTEYDALIDEFNQDVRDIETGKDESMDDFSTDVIQVIPEQKNDVPAFNYDSNLGKSHSENDDKINEEEIMGDNKDKKNKDSDVKKQIDDSFPKKSRDELSSSLGELDELNQFSNDDEKASDELAIEFTTLLKKMRDKAKLVAEQEPVIKDDDEDDEIPGYNPTIEQPKEIELPEIEASVPEKAPESQFKSEPEPQPEPEPDFKPKLKSDPQPEVKTDTKSESDPLPSLKPTTQVQPKPQSKIEPKAEPEEPFIPSLKKQDRKEEVKPIPEDSFLKWEKSKDQNSDKDERALPSLKTIKKQESQSKEKEVSSERKEIKKEKSKKVTQEKRRKRPDLSFAGMILVIILLIIALAIGAYFAGLFEKTDEFDPFFTEQPVDVETPVIDDENGFTVDPGTPVTPTPESEIDVTPREHARPLAGASANYGLRGSFDMSNTDFSGIIVASLSEESTARRTASNLISAGFRVHHYNLELPNGRSTWRVVVGQFQNHEEATQAATQLPEPYRNNNFVTNVKL
jgi:nucleoid DNA-binding protein